MTSLLPPQYLSRADLERCSSVRISRYIISVPSRYSCNSVLRIYLLILSRSCSVHSPTSVLRTPAYSPRAWTPDLRPLGPPQVEGTDGVSGRWSITSPKPSTVSAELRTGTPEPRTPRGTALTVYPNSPRVPPWIVRTLLTPTRPSGDSPRARPGPPSQSTLGLRQPRHISKYPFLRTSLLRTCQGTQQFGLLRRSPRTAVRTTLWCSEARSCAESKPRVRLCSRWHRQELRIPHLRTHLSNLRRQIPRRS